MITQFRWLLRFFKSGTVGRERPRGLILLQVDGLSLKRFEQGMQTGRLPFLKRLMVHDDYHLHSLYSGIPSSTPAVQAELFYGVKTAVPSFGFKDRETNKITSMFNRAMATRMEEKISRNNFSLLEEGSAYGDVYTGGSLRSRFCLSFFKDKKRKNGPLSLLPGILRSPYNTVLYAGMVGRATILTVVECILAVKDFITGIVNNHSFIKELKFIPARITVCVILRELVKAHVLNDISEGVPLIHANFLGYDEQAHRRGPASGFALWTLRGIDATLGAIWHKAHASKKRHYDIWFYSDHGQEESVPYAKMAHRTLKKAIEETAQKEGIELRIPVKPIRSMMHMRSVLLEKEGLRKENEEDGQSPVSAEVTGLGPLVHVYPTRPIPKEKLYRFSKALVRDAGIPLVMTGSSKGGGVAWNKNGVWDIEKDCAEVVGKNHPFLKEISNDLLSMLHNEYSGDLVLSGWMPGEQPISFPIENGAHAGPGTEETHGFCYVPGEVSFSGREYVRPIDIREAALSIQHPAQSIQRYEKKSTRKKKIRIMTYNIHSCISIDGTSSLERIARIIRRYHPDIVALQEIDVSRSRTGFVDQAGELARRLNMTPYYFPSVLYEDGSYGNALLSKFPVTSAEKISLPAFGSGELRTAIRLNVEGNDIPFTVIATHFSFYPRERHQQITHLLDNEKIGEIKNCLICGDFNMIPQSKSYRLMKKYFNDVSRGTAAKIKGSWMGLTALDYIFISVDLSCTKVKIPYSRFIRHASDHLPLIADIALKK